MFIKKLFQLISSILGLITIGFNPLLYNAAKTKENVNQDYGTLTITLEAGNYSLQSVDGKTQIQMEKDFGTFSSSGEPQLPGRTFYIVLPPGAIVTSVRFSTPQAIDLSGSYTLVTVRPAVTDNGVSLPSGADQPRSGTGQEEVYAGDRTSPSSVGEYLGQDTWRAYSLAQVAFQPFQYYPLSGALRFYPQMDVTIDYRLPVPGSPEWAEVQRLQGDHVMDDLIAGEAVNFNQAQAWYGGNSNQPAEASTYDYVIIVENDSYAAAVAPFAAWKQSLGHSVKVVTMIWIESNYTGANWSERIWNFLYDKYPASAWGIRYVMLVGDLQIIPTPRIYYADQGWGYRSDHFYSKLSGGATVASVWNHDGDVRWGELHDDQMTVTPDVLVGRIPLNQIMDISNAVHAMIAYEQDTGGWKHNALLAAGYNDIETAAKKTDNAVLMELIKNNLLTPNGWGSTRLYEEQGLGTSTYNPPPDGEADPATVVANWNANNYGLVLLANHANAGGLSGLIWKYDTGNIGTVDDGELVWKDLFKKTNAAELTNTHPSIWGLFGCGSIMLDDQPWPNPDTSDAPIGSYVDNTGSTLMAQGAAAGVVGFTSPVPYASYWSSVNDGEESAAAYYFAEDLIQNHYSFGWSVYETAIRYTSKYWNNNYEPFHWALNLYGDPSMVLEGYDMSARGTNQTIYTGPVYAYGADNDDNGDMYVAVSTEPSTYGSGQIWIYRSQDHGMTWTEWSGITIASPGILAVDVLVGNYSNGDFSSRALNVFYSDTAGYLYDTRFDLDHASTLGTVQIANEGASANIVNLSVARDPLLMPSYFNIYLAWQSTEGSSNIVHAAVSTLNGTIWTDQVDYSGFRQPHIDAGPGGYIYLTAVGDDYPYDVYVKRNNDYGSSSPGYWGNWTNLTMGDGANYHVYPVVASSSDSSPTAWVVYSINPAGSSGLDLRFAYSIDQGASWTPNQPLIGEPNVDEIHADLATYRAAPNPYVNLAYDIGLSTGTQVMWRYIHKSTPINWSAQRMMNDQASQTALGPRVIYSPGASVPGGGVIYPGAVDNLYFAAPWLTSIANFSQANLDTSPGLASVGLTESQPGSVLMPTNTSYLPPVVWEPTGSIPVAFRVASLARNQAGVIFAAATTSAVTGANTGTVFRSDDNGVTWTPTGVLPNAWWLDSMLVTKAGTLLAGGISCSDCILGGVAHPAAAIYRSTNNGDSWTLVAGLPSATTVHTLLQRASSELVAGTGSSGLIYNSDDDGQNWNPMAYPGPLDHIYALWETGDGTLYAGGAIQGGGGIIFELVDGNWQAISLPDGISTVYALCSQGSTLYAGIATQAGTGAVVWTSDNGATWQSAPGLQAGVAVRSLLVVSGSLFAGLDYGSEFDTSYIYFLPQGGAAWQTAGALFMADTAYSLLWAPGNRMFIASGGLSGVVFVANPYQGWNRYLPLVRR